MKLSLRVKIALAVLAGKTKGRYGPKTVCPDFVLVSGATAYHQDGWELIFDPGGALCEGTVPVTALRHDLPEEQVRNGLKAIKIID